MTRGAIKSSNEARSSANLRELSPGDLEHVSGGYRITNVRVNANGLSGGGPTPG
jgi:hypothetical protein